MKQYLLKQKRTIISILFISLCFFLTSTGYLAWLYHLLDLASAEVPELLTMGLGYLFQAVGIGMFALFSRKKASCLGVRSFAVVLVAYLVCLIPSITVGDLVVSAVFGVLSNLLCGIIAGFYLYRLVKTDPGRRAMTFGTGYGIAVFASWLLTLIGNGAAYRANTVISISVVLSAAAILIFRGMQSDEAGDRSKPQGEGGSITGTLLAAACVTVFLFSVVNHIGFSFPSSDIGSGVDLEFSRLFYAVGLVIAGVVSDKNRRAGTAATLVALIIPFITLTLRGEIISSMILWSLSYFASGFFSVYRVILFADLAESKKAGYLSGFGLLFGRLGEAIGTGLFVPAASRTVVLVVIAAVLYTATVFLFFWMYQKLYMPTADREKKDRARFQRFAVKHDLSPREKEILTLLLERETSPAIAEKLFVSESTVKFHVHNLLRKTGCKNRKELSEKYRSEY